MAIQIGPQNPWPRTATEKPRRGVIATGTVWIFRAVCAVIEFAARRVHEWEDSGK